MEVISNLRAMTSRGPVSQPGLSMGLLASLSPWLPASVAGHTIFPSPFPFVANLTNMFKCP